VERVDERLLRRLNDRRDPAAVDRQVDQDGGNGQIPIPDVVVDHLEVPATLPGPDIDGDQAAAEEVAPGSEAGEVVVGRGVRREIDQAQLGVGGERRPYVDVAAPAPGVVLPGFVPELALARNCAERPEVLAGPRIERLYVAGDVLDPGAHAAARVRRVA